MSIDDGGHKEIRIPPGPVTHSVRGNPIPFFGTLSIYNHGIYY